MTLRSIEETNLPVIQKNQIFKNILFANLSYGQKDCIKVGDIILQPAESFIYKWADNFKSVVCIGTLDTGKPNLTTLFLENCLSTEIHDVISFPYHSNYTSEYKHLHEKFLLNKYPDYRVYSRLRGGGTYSKFFEPSDNISTSTIIHVEQPLNDHDLLVHLLKGNRFFVESDILQSGIEEIDAWFVELVGKVDTLTVFLKEPIDEFPYNYYTDE